MNKRFTSEFIQKYNIQSASLLLVILLFTDLVFVIMCGINAVFDWGNELFFVGTDGGFAELYQYIKWFWIICLFVFISLRNRSLGYMVWSLFFLYFLLDDALMLHESYGETIAQHLSFIPPLGLRPQDVGELTVIGIAGLVLLVLVALAYFKGTQNFRSISVDFMLLVFVLAVFAVVMDMFNAAMGFEEQAYGFVTLIEDGAEMFVASFMVWYAFLLSVREKESTAYLYQWIPTIDRWVPKMVSYQIR